MSEAEFEALKKSIADDGHISVAVIVNEEGIVLDGHHRFRACKELDLPLRTITTSFPDKLREMQFVIEVNLRRRHLNEFEKAEMGLKLEQIEEKKALQREQATQFKPGHTFVGKKEQQEKPGEGSKSWHVSPDIDPKKPTTSKQQPVINRKTLGDMIAKRVGISRSSYERSKKIILKGSEQQKIQLRKGDVGIRKVYSQIRRDEKRFQLMQQIGASSSQSQSQPQEGKTTANKSQQQQQTQVQLHNVDFRKLAPEQLPSESVDLIFTDPPYSQDTLLLYQDLAKFGSNWLKEGGCLVTTAAHYALPQILDYMTIYNLHYWWIVCVKHSGGKSRMHNQRLLVGWKPLLWFVKGPKGTRPANQVGDMEDYILSKPPEGRKIVHEWEQSTVEAQYMIENLTVEGQTVMDPFLGSGTVGIAATRLKRKFIGCEVDRTFFNTAEYRIGQNIR